MITIQSGKLMIPEEDRFVGFAGDNLGNSKSFVIPGQGSDSGRYSLCLRFDDDSVRVIPLTKSLSSGDLILTWTIRSTHLQKSGVVMAQIKSVDDNDVVMHTTCDYFIVAQSAESSEDAIAYVTREEQEERLTAFLEQIRDSAPYIGEDGYWYVYDVETDDYVRSVKATPDSITVDNAMIAGSTNPVQSCVIRAFVESALDSKVSKSTRIAGLQLNGNISQADLAASLCGNINPPLVVPDSTLGYGGQYGKTSAGEPVMCMLGNTWIKLATQSDLSAKMDLAPDVNVLDVDEVQTGQLFTCQGGVMLKTATGHYELAKKANVYSKSEINSMIGNIETLLAAV